VAHLTLVLQGREVRKFVLNPSVTTIGRAQDNDIVINNLALSRRHAQVEKKGNRFEVTDLGSQNGVYVNSERVRGARALGNEDTITLGTYHFVFNDIESDPDVKAVPKHRIAGEITGNDVMKKPEPPPPDEHVPLLVLKYNDVELQRFPLKNEISMVGRAKDCDIQIAERRLSRKHCEIHRKDGRFVVHDLGSQNGTYVNRKRIRDPHVLEDGDVLNFAEYSVHYLADNAKYDGPDLVHARRQAANARTGQAGFQGGRESNAPGPRPDSGIEREETEFPEAYGEQYDDANAPSIVPNGDEDRVRPQDLEDPEDDHGDPRMPLQMSPVNGRPKGDPFIEDPAKSKERRKNVPPNRVPREAPPAQKTRDARPTRELPREERREPPREERREPAREERREARAEPPREAPRARPSPGAETGPSPVVESRRPAGKKPVKELPQRAKPEMEDVPDDQGDILPDEGLEDWYKAREEKSEVFEREDSSVLLRGKSSVSKILSTMMVDKKELDRNLAVKAKQRRFFVDVRHGNEKIYSGPLMQQVTILGTDRDADIQLRGRYVAGRHSILVRVKDSLLLVRLGSSSAARVNGLPKLQAFLKTGDVIQIDETTIKISED
jgi:pSer/pThr/pTyr-binding forkhead associated (FHA) protein